MRITTEKLHRLIQTLKKEEKRYFKLFVSTTKSSKKYLNIFEVLDKMEELDEKKYKSSTKGIKSRSSLQTYLYQSIIKSLQLQYQDKGLEMEMLDGLLQIELFYNRKMFAEAEEMVEEMLQRCKETGVFIHQPALYHWAFRLKIIHQFKGYSFEDYRDLKEQYHQSFKESKDFLDVFLLQADYLFGGNSSSRNKEVLYKEIEENLKKYKDLDNPIVRIFVYHLRATLLSAERKIYEAFDAQLEAIQYLEANKEKLPPKYMSYGSSFVFNAFNNARYMPKEYMQKLRPHIDTLDYEELHLRQQFYRYYIPFIIHLQNEEYEQALALAPTVLEHKSSLLITIQQELLFEMAVMHFMLKDYDPCLAFIEEHNKIRKKLENRTNFGLQYSILEALVYYEKDEDLLLPYILKRSKRTLKKEETYFEFEQLFLNFLGRLCRLPKSERRNEFVKFKGELQDFVQSCSVTEREFLLYFNYEGWLDSKIEGRPFTQMFYAFPEPVAS